MLRIDYRQLFQKMHPGFFEKPNIRRLPADRVLDEMVLPLEDYAPDRFPVKDPPGIRYDLFHGNRDMLLDAVGSVDETWIPIYREENSAFCAFMDERPVSFCIVEPMGVFDSVKVGGPGCVGTVPAFRKKGIGLRMVQLVTGILKSEGYDLSYIHFTGVPDWYAKLGYQTVLRWNSQGILENAI